MFRQCQMKRQAEYGEWHCGAAAPEGKDYCFQHDPSRQAERLVAQERGRETRKRNADYWAGRMKEKRERKEREHQRQSNCDHLFRFLRETKSLDDLFYCQKCLIYRRRIMED